MIRHILIIVVGGLIQWIQAQDCLLSSPCIFNKTSGFITSPGYPNDYPGHKNLAWLIQAPYGHSVHLAFKTFELERSEKCKFDHVAVYDGNTTGSPIIGKYCGSVRPTDQFSSLEELLVVFMSDHMHEAAGFYISFEAIERVHSCSGNHSAIQNLNIIMKEPQGLLKTHFNSSTTQLHCVWKIRAPQSHGIRFTIRTYNILPKHCLANSVSLYTGNTLQQRFCWLNITNNLPITKYNSQRHLDVELKARQIPSPWNAQSFVAFYEFVQKDISKCSVMNNPQENTNIILNGYHGNFTVDKTWKDMECRWRINAPDKHQLKLTFTSFQLVNDCRMGYVQIIDGNYINRGKFCGPEVPWDIVSTSGFLVVKLFATGSSNLVRVTGVFDAVTIAQDRCSRMNSEHTNTNIQLTNKNGLIMTPNYPSHYPSRFKCAWTIKVPTNYRIKLHFKAFEFESHECRYDYVEVRDGGTNTSKTITGRICGESNIPNDVYSTTNQLWIWFSSDHNEERSGFLAYYKAVLPEPSKCALVNTVQENTNIQIRSKSGHIASPNYPLVSPSIKCAWYIAVPGQSRVIVHFNDLSLIPWCNDVYFAVHNGNCTCDQVLGTMCDHDRTLNTVAAGNSITIVYIKAKDSHFKGFNLTYHTPRTGSGVCSIANSRRINSNLVIDKPSGGEITSPDYPFSMYPTSQCTWFINAPVGYHVLLKLTTMNMSCANNYLEVRDGDSIKGLLKGRFCTVKEPKLIFSSGQKLVLRYTAPQPHKYDPKHSGKFRATYQMIKEGNCSGYFVKSWNTNLVVNTRYDILSSPDYPRPYPPNIKCTWKVIAPYKSRLKLNFGLYSFDGLCSTDFIEVKDGFSSDGRLLGKFCQHVSPKEVQSAGRYMLIHFESGSNFSHSIRKFKIIVSAVSTEDSATSSFETVLIIGFMAFAGFIIFSVCLMCSYWLYKKERIRRRRRRAPLPGEHQTNFTMSSIPHPIMDDIPTCLIAEDRPPPYDDAIQTNDNNQAEMTSRESSQSRDRCSSAVERGLDNPAFSGDPPSYESLYGSRELESS